MARLDFTAANTVAQPLLANTAKTALQITAPANHCVAIKQLTISFDGVVNTNVPVFFKLVVQTTAGTTSSPSATAKKKVRAMATTVQTTVADGFTVEPTSTDVLWTGFCHPQTGMVWPLPVPGEIVIDGGGRVGLVCNAPQAVDVIVAVECEE